LTIAGCVGDSAARLLSAILICPARSGHLLPEPPGKAKYLENPIPELTGDLRRRTVDTISAGKRFDGSNRSKHSELADFGALKGVRATGASRTLGCAGTIVTGKLAWN